jgi:hypothetical protein
MGMMSRKIYNIRLVVGICRRRLLAREINFVCRPSESIEVKV